MGVEIKVGSIVCFGSGEKARRIRVKDVDEDELCYEEPLWAGDGSEHLDSVGYIRFLVSCGAATIEEPRERFDRVWRLVFDDRGYATVRGENSNVIIKVISHGDLCDELASKTCDLRITGVE